MKLIALALLSAKASNCPPSTSSASPGIAMPIPGDEEAVEVVIQGGESAGR